MFWMSPTSGFGAGCSVSGWRRYWLRRRRGLSKAPTVTLTDSYRGAVEISLGGLWVLQDSEPEGWGYDDYPSDFAGITGDEGVYLISGHYSGVIDVTVEVHSAPPEAPSGWEKSGELVGIYPSRVAKAWCEILPADDGLASIELPAERVGLRVLVNGWSTPPNPGSPAETWLLQVWPADAGRSACRGV